MNTRSIRFQLTVWYAGLLTGCFVLLGLATYFVLDRYLEGTLEDSQLQRARQIAQLLTTENQHQELGQTEDEVELRYAPGLNHRFIRVTRQDGKVFCLSAAPQDRVFDPNAIPRFAWPASGEKVYKVSLGLGHQLLLLAYVYSAPGGTKYLIESGALMDPIEDILRHWLIFLLAVLPLLALMAVGGGYLLLNRALLPVDQIAASAERISSQNLSERLPVSYTGDELERLSLALNHMIQRLDDAFQYSRRFVADASHELRTPLTVLRGELESVVDEPHLSDDLRARLGSTLEEVERLATIVEGLFAISRLDAGEAQAEWVKFDLAKLAASTADQMYLLAEDKSIRLTCSAEKNILVEGDRARMKQVIVNLLDNAIKYTPYGGAVTVSVKANNGKAVLEVADNGIGIPPEALPHVFERFFRVDKARSRDQGGAGLGLSIVKSICTFHHGQVTVNSIPNQGSRFQVELPRLEPTTSNA